MLATAEHCARTKKSTTDYYTVRAIGPMLDRVFSLRYKSYLADGYIDASQTEKFMDKYDAQPNNSSYLLYQRNDVVASIRSCIYDPEENTPVPCMDIFKSEIVEAVGLDEKFVEVNKFAVDPSFRAKGGRRARLLLFSTVVAETQKSGAKSVVVAIRPGHINFYKRFQCEQISDAKRYPGLDFETVLMVCRGGNISEAADTIMSQSLHKRRLNEPVSRYGNN